MSTIKEVREEKQSQFSRKGVILRLLKEAGPAGRTNLELNEICLRYGARLAELRKHYVIETQRLDGGLFNFVLKGKRQPEQLRLIA